MKKLLFTWLFSLFCCFVQAQNIAYVPMLKAGNSWLMQYLDFSHQFSYLEKSDKDSTVNGKKYQLFGNDLMREDSAQAKVYFYKNGKDNVLYDFNLKVGDVMDYSAINNISNCKYKVKSIENIKFYDGTQTKKLELFCFQIKKHHACRHRLKNQWD